MLRSLILASCVLPFAFCLPAAEQPAFFPIAVWYGVRPLESGRDTLAFVFNHYSQAASPSVALKLPRGNYTGADLITGESIPLSREGSVVKLAGRLGPTDLWVVHLTPQ